MSLIMTQIGYGDIVYAGADAGANILLLSGLISIPKFFRFVIKSCKIMYNVHGVDMPCDN
jgi:hypothetical protein